MVRIHSLEKSLNLTGWIQILEVTRRKRRSTVFRVITNTFLHVIRKSPGGNVEYLRGTRHGGFKRISILSTGREDSSAESHSVQENLIRDSAPLSFG